MMKLILLRKVLAQFRRLLPIYSEHDMLAIRNSHPASPRRRQRQVEDLHPPGALTPLLRLWRHPVHCRIASLGAEVVGTVAQSAVLTSRFVMATLKKTLFIVLHVLVGSSLTQIHLLVRTELL